MTTLAEKLSAIQTALNAPKNQLNKFGGYNYRSCEDICMAVKPLLHGLSLTLTDTMELIGERYYVKAVASITDGKETISTVAYAREAKEKKGMDESQITGATSSYARKYALNGLLLIDDNKDADATNDHGKAPQAPAPKPEPVITEEQAADVAAMIEEVGADESAVLKFAGVYSIRQIPASKLKVIVAKLNAKREGNK